MRFRQQHHLDLARRAWPVRPILCPLAARGPGPYHFRKSEAQTLRPVSAQLLCGKTKTSSSSSSHLFHSPNPRWVNTKPRHQPLPRLRLRHRPPPGAHSPPPARRSPAAVPTTVPLAGPSRRRTPPSTLARRASCLAVSAQVRVDTPPLFTRARPHNRPRAPVTFLSPPPASPGDPASAPAPGCCSRPGASQFARVAHRGTPAAGPSIYPPRRYSDPVVITPALTPLSRANYLCGSVDLFPKSEVASVLTRSRFAGSAITLEFSWSAANAARSV
jgi:hypothetical protein